MHVHYGSEEAHKAKLVKGLATLGPDFLASLCWWCDGSTKREFESCNVCSDNGYGSALGLLVGGKPAPVSVVNQVLIAGGGQ